MSPIWLPPARVDPRAACALARELRVAPCIAELLIRRGLVETEIAARFLEPRLKTLSDPFLLPDMERAVERLLAAIDRRERIVLYGDYDVDGVTSLALFTRVLRAFGADPHCFLPLRVDEGYGLSADGASRCVETFAPQLLVAVDCGTSSVAEIAALRADGVDVIVIDHHEIKDGLPDCVALVNPKRGDTFHYLCSVGLVFKVAHALMKRRHIAGFDLRDHLDLVALGTVADLVPLVEENRLLVKHGLARLARTSSIGLRELMDVAGVRAPIAPNDISFKLGPRMNAAGRLGTAEAALELLMTENPSRARTIARELDVQNRERRTVEDDVHLQAEAQLAEWFDAARDSAIVVGGDGWHPGVIGIVASRLLRAHHRPALVIGFDEQGIGKGSGRSIDGLSLVEALQQCSGHLERFGGHEMAAGLTVRRERFVAFRDAFRACARQMLSAEQLQARLRLDVELTLGEINFELLEQYCTLQPFGMGNHQPTFFARGVTLAGEPRVMREKHLSLMLRQRGDEYRAVWFAGVSETLPRLPWDVAFHLERNEYMGAVSAQIHIRAVRSAK
jgi:single-stranded-DNA-specific exonuclease